MKYIKSSYPLLQLLALVFLFFVLMYLVWHPVPENMFGVRSDEGYYYRYSQQILVHGVSGFRGLVEWYHGSVEASLHPNPIRVGYIFCVALLHALFGNSYSIMGAFSTVSFMFFLLFNYIYVRKHFSSEKALAVVLLLATSPLLLGLSRRALVDGTIVLFWSLALWLSYEMIGSKFSFKRMLSLSLVLWLGLLFKEATFLLMVVIVWGMLFFHSINEKIDWKGILGAVSLAMGGYFLLLFSIMGGLQGVGLILGSTFATHTKLSAQSAYALYFSSGPWTRYLVDFLLLIPLELLLSVGFIFYALIDKKCDKFTSYWIVVLLGLYTIFSLFPYSKVVRMVAVLELPLALFAMSGVYLLCEHGVLARVRIYPLALVILIAGTNFIVFNKIFVGMSLLDPVTYHLGWMLGFFPFNGTLAVH